MRQDKEKETQTATFDGDGGESTSEPRNVNNTKTCVPQKWEMRFLTQGNDEYVYRTPNPG